MPHSPPRLPFLPATPDELAQRDWDFVDVVFVTGDAYVDHPSFAAAILGRMLEALGWRVAILSQPDWRSVDPWRAFGRPRVCFAVSAGNMDSMINHYTANRKVRNDDAYSPGGRIGLRPDRATAAYCQRAREAFRGVPIIAGGIEASLRRLAHYDFWSDKVRRSILLDAKPDLLVHGMGERVLAEIVRRLAEGETVRQLRDLPGVAYRLGASERATLEEAVEQEEADDAEGTRSLWLPSFEAVSTDLRAFARMTRQAHREAHPDVGRRLLQSHDRETIVVNPPQPPLTETELDRLYALPFTRLPHPSYGRTPIPALEVVRHSITIMRGCPGGCSFCSITVHQGREVQSRSQASVLAEVDAIASQPGFRGTISDLGGPTANLYQMRCTRTGGQAGCRRGSCLHPEICSQFNVDHAPLLALMRGVSEHPKVHRVLIASGVRMDVACRSDVYVRVLVEHHTGGRLKVAPEHSHPGVLRLAGKPPITSFDQFAERFADISAESGKPQQLIPYFLAGLPGCDLRAMIELAIYLKRTGYRPLQVQEFIPGPFDMATCMYHTGLDPMTMEEVHVAKGERERRLQRALLQFFKPENYFDVRSALREAGRTDLIGSRPTCLIPSEPPEEAGRRKGPTPTASNRPDEPKGYRPKRKTARRRNRE